VNSVFLMRPAQGAPRMTIDEPVENTVWVWQPGGRSGKLVHADPPPMCSVSGREGKVSDNLSI
jgi:hypothetical protein